MRLLACLLAVCLCTAVTSRSFAQSVTIFAAASLNESLKAVAEVWTVAGHPAPKLSFASSSTLARQIEQGAPADLFASADERWMDELDRKGLLAPGTRVNLLENKLVLVVARNQPRSISLDHGFDASAILGADGRLAVGDPDHVPAGIYAEQALTKLGAWEQVKSRLARAEDVRGALRLVELGEAPAGIVYSTDAAASDKVMVAGIFPAGSHDQIVYPFAVLRDGNRAAGVEVLSFLRGDRAREIFAKYGFGVMQ